MKVCSIGFCSRSGSWKVSRSLARAKRKTTSPPCAAMNVLCCTIFLSFFTFDSRTPEAVSSSLPLPPTETDNLPRFIAKFTNLERPIATQNRIPWLKVTHAWFLHSSEPRLYVSFRALVCSFCGGTMTPPHSRLNRPTVPHYTPCCAFRIFPCARGAIRLAQAETLMAHVAAFLRGRFGCDYSTVPVVLAGDLNTVPGVDVYRCWPCDNG